MITALDELGDLSAEPGSRAWAIAIRDEIQSALHNRDHAGIRLESLVKVMREHKGYRSLTDVRGRQFATYENFCTSKPPFGLGYKPDAINAIVAERKALEAKDRAQIALPLAEPGEIGRGRDRVGNTNSKASDHDADYLTARIARDRPDILERMKAGEYRSVRAAALEAGIVNPSATIPTHDPVAAGRRLLRHFQGERLALLIHTLSKGMEF